MEGKQQTNMLAEKHVRPNNIPEMKAEYGKIISFDIENLKDVSVTHGYHIANDFPVHFHSSYNIGMTEQGEREFFYRGRTYLFQKGDIFFIQPFEPHSCKAKGHSGHSYKILSFYSKKMLYFPDFTIYNPQLLSILQAFHTIAEYEKTSPKLAQLFTSIMAQLERYATTFDQNKENAGSNKIEQAKAYIEENCLQELSLKKMARVACLSEYHFDRYFHKYFGLSPYAYYLVCKVKKAQKLLAMEESVTATSLASGFFDQSHFTRLFKKHVGVTPGKYLKDNRKHRPSNSRITT